MDYQGIQVLVLLVRGLPDFQVTQGFAGCQATVDFVGYRVTRVSVA